MRRFIVGFGEGEVAVTQDDDGVFIIPDEVRPYLSQGTALKPAYEPIVLARKPLEGTVAYNVLKHGVGGINVDGCRIDTAPVPTTIHGLSSKEGSFMNCREAPQPFIPNQSGRWPSNLLLDEESGKLLDLQSGELIGAGNVRGVNTNSMDKSIFGIGHAIGENPNYYDNKGGGASRFFYIAKADRFEREAGLVGNVECSRCKKLVEEGQWPVHQGDHIYNDHPTVKPIELMRYLVRLVTPKGGICLDPFVGSGTTLIADMFEGVNGVGIEKDAEKDGAIFHRLEYWKPIAERRKTEEAQERKEQAHRIAETVRTLDTFESEGLEQEQDQLGDGSRTDE